MRLRGLFFLTNCAASAAAIHYLESANFNITVDSDTGAILSIVNPKDNATMNWIGGPDNTPWQPLGNRWGLGYADLGNLHRAYWDQAVVTAQGDRIKSSYRIDNLQLDVTRALNKASAGFQECYSFTNTGDKRLSLNDAGTESLAISTPFNDHYTSTSNVLEHRAHAHIWASGGGSSWVKQTRMGLRGPHLGLVLTEGALAGYSVQSRNTITSSNTRGFFLLHPDLASLESKESSQVCWTMFWHNDWDDFFKQCKDRSSQFVHVESSNLTVAVGETANLTLSSSGDNISFPEGKLVSEGDGQYLASFQPSTPGEHRLSLSTGQGAQQRISTIVLNAVSNIDNLIRSRVRYIATKQQLSPSFSDQSKAGAYAVYDNQMDGIVTFDTAPDRNTGRERVGMGVFVARWLQANPDPDIERSLRIYYDYVNNKLQDSSGYVYSGPIGSGDSQERLYNWPWVMQLHLAMAKSGNKMVTSHGNYSATPIQRFLDTVENFYSIGGKNLYAIGLPIYEGLNFLKESENQTALQHVLHLFTLHGKQIAENGANYPAFEVNYEQSIIAPAANILLELYRFTGLHTWLEAAQGHFDRLEAFGGKQPDFHLHDIAIRHWDGYWFGKDRMWGDTFPHYWSTLTALAMHHYAIATDDMSYETRAEGILRANLVLFTEEGRGHCAFIYPVSVDGRKGYYNDPYANDQDWALAHLLQIQADRKERG